MAFAITKQVVGRERERVTDRENGRRIYARKKNKKKIKKEGRESRIRQITHATATPFYTQLKNTNPENITSRNHTPCEISVWILITTVKEGLCSVSDSKLFDTCCLCILN